MTAAPVLQPRQPAAPVLLGCDFSSAPRHQKPIVVAQGVRQADAVVLTALHRCASLDDWQQLLQRWPAWVGAFDLPFGLPRPLVRDWGWPLDWAACMDAYAVSSRDELKRRFRLYCQHRPPGAKFAHRATDRVAGSSPSMKWVNPPVAWMMHVGVPGLRALGAWFPGLSAGAMPPQPQRRAALEAYPGFWARRVLGRRSYKADAARGQTEERRQARAHLLLALESGLPGLGLRLQVTDPLRAELLADARADTLDAAICLLQAAWAAERADTPGPGYGLPVDMDPLEGWIVGVSTA